ncbi:MAG: sulfate adenylyltransferase [Candidatus Omnitrophica bacterium]|nr:sulfate adenylyltransferase [Candidatus Omnitrophota bacterium]
MLVNRQVPEDRANEYLKELDGCKTYTISRGDLSMFYRIADGTLSPLEGPMGSGEFDQVLEKEFITRNGKKYAWTIPVVFPAGKAEAENFSPGEKVRVEDEDGRIVGGLTLTEIYGFDKEKYNRSVYGTGRTDHPGPRIVNDDPRDILVAGTIEALPQPKDDPCGRYILPPEETRGIFSRKGWDRVVAFQTRNPLHRAHEYALVYGLEKLTRDGFFAGAVLNPLIGETKSDDVPASVRMKTYEALINGGLIGEGDKDEDLWSGRDYAFSDQVLLMALDVKMFYAGPKEAIMHAIYRQNLGFTDIVIGRKHADAPFDDGEPVWGDFDAQRKFDEMEGELLIEPVKVGYACFYEELGKVALMDDCKDRGWNAVTISGKDLRKKLHNGEAIDERIMRKPVADILEDHYSGKERSGGK